MAKNRRNLLPNNFKVVDGFIPVDEAHDLARQVLEVCNMLPYDTRPNFAKTKCASNFLPFYKLLVRKLPHVEALIG
jgi:hypothetical protein